MSSRERSGQVVESGPGWSDPSVPSGEARRFTPPASEPVLIAAARAGEARLGIVFGGQGAGWLPELRELHGQHLAVRTLVRAAAERLRSAASDPRLGALATPARGFDLVRWIEQADAAPPAHVLSSSLVSQPGIFLTQVARVVALGEKGFDLEALVSLATSATGHSQGVMSAVLAAEGHGFSGFVRRAAEFASYFFWQGYRMQESFVLAAVPPSVREAAEKEGLGEPTPMAAISGLTTELLEGALALFHEANPQLPAIDLSLDNTFTRKVVSGPPVSLVAFARALATARKREQELFQKGKLGRRPIDFKWEFVQASAPFHSRYMEHGHHTLPSDLAREGIRLQPSALKIPVLAHDGRDLRLETSDEALLEALVRMQHVEPVKWQEVCRGLRQSHPEGITHLLDFGPGDAVAKLTAVNCRGFGVHVFPTATEAGRRELFAPTREELPHGLDYRTFAPRLRREPTGEIVLDNAFRRFTGRPPVFLPGMTPTTSDAPIVAAAANAGFVSELAGGGQVTDRHFRLRSKELQRLLEPGAAYTVNLLYLDPYLWNLHWKNERMVTRLRQEGAAIEGITVSAGIPELAEAKELLDTCRAQGLGLVSFKPGTLKQIQHVIEIARACPDHQMGVQIEGGKAGGHHSWEDLRELVRTTYHQLRECPNVVLSVGGGIRTEEDAHQWLTGAWSEQLGLAPMPVDAVFLGTIAMAAKEAMTSPQVKQLLVQTKGTDEWVANGAAKGGVTSGKSQLDADIHYVDNTAAKVGRLLDEVAGKPELAQARKAEIVAALAKTAKPYFGDLTEMSHAQVLRRMVQLMAIGRGTEYEDGRFPDPSYRQRVHDLALRLEERLATQAGPSVVRSLADLDDPEAFVARFVEAYPHAETTQLAQADADFFVQRICQRPGKPVNFVPAIDGDVRRWYKSDSLWQSHDERYDADAVLVIPGPEAVQGIVRADEPVGEMLGRFVKHTIEKLQAEGQQPVDARDGIDRHGLARAARAAGLVLKSPADGVIVATTAAQDMGAGKPKQAQVQGWLEALDSVLLAPIAAATGVLRDGALVANPMGRLLRVEAGDSWTAIADASGRLASLAVKRVSGHAVELSLTRQGRTGRCDVTLVHALPSDRFGNAREVKLSLSFERDLAHGARYPQEVSPQRALRIGEFYRSAMVGEGAPVGAGDEVRATFAVTRDFIREYAIASGDQSVAHVGGRTGPRSMPLNAAFSAAFGAIFRATFVPDVAWDPSRLVHLDNQVQLTAGPLHENETLDVSARLVAWEPAKGGVRIRTRATLSHEGTERARVDSTFFVQGEQGTFTFRCEERTHRLPANDAALLDLLREKSWLKPQGAIDESASHALRIELRTTTQQGTLRADIQGVMTDAAGKTVALVRHEETGKDAAETEPARWLAKFAPVAEPTVALPQPSPAHVDQAFAPGNLGDFARASLDANPLHRDSHAAALAGFDVPIVHGQWTAARSIAAAVSGFAGTDGARVRCIEVNFTDVVLPGDELEIRARHSAMHQGDLVVDVETTAKSRATDEGRLALRGRVRIAAPRTAYVFPGQGVQATGMGMDGYQRSAAARKVWDEADAYCRDVLGFSLLTVVRDNPNEMRVGLEIHRHEQGVLFLTQFTQVAMAVLAIAQVAELREAGCFQEDAPFCGHSVGEYSAIGAITSALSLPAIVECVYHRGLTMQTYVPRDQLGRSPYRMAVVRPNVVGMKEKELVQLVAQVASETGLLCEVVNFNIRGRQYSVVGHVPALELLRAKLAEREPAGSKPSYLEVPGIDVPFHSVALRDGVPAFREKLDRLMPAQLDVAPLLDRYIPNLVARPFSLSREFLDETIRSSDSEILIALRERWDREGVRPAELGRALFIEGLAYQFASPVRWIETQDVLLARGAYGVQRVIEIGLGSAPTQANMFRATLAMDPSRLDAPSVQNVEGDRKGVFHLYDAESDAPAATTPAAAPVAAAAPVTAPAAAPAARGPAAPVTDVPLTVKDSLVTVLALKARVRADEVRIDETIEALFGGNSSRRNQVLADIGAEFGVGAIDGAHEMPIGKLAEALEKATGGRYRTQGAYLRAQVTAALKPFGLATKDALGLFTSRGLPEGRSLALLNRLALWARAGESTRSGPLSPVAPPKAGDRAAAMGWLDQTLQRYTQDEGISLASGGSAGGGATVDAAALEGMLARYFGVGGAFLETLRFAEAALGRDVWADLEVKAAADVEESERLGRYDAEHGAQYEKAIRPAFAAEKAVVFSGSWAWARREAVALYHQLRGGTATAQGIEEAVQRIARGGDAATLRTVGYLQKRSERRGDQKTAEVFARLSKMLDPQAIPCAASDAVPLRPMVEVRADGTLRDGEVPRGGEATALEVARELLQGNHARLRAHVPAGISATGDAQEIYRTALLDLAKGQTSFAGRTALVTGASDRSIAIELVKLLLTGGARVVVTTSQHTPERIRFYRRLFQRYGARGAELAVVPFNQGSKQDIQRLVTWLVSAEKTTVGSSQRVVKEPWLVDLLVPFGAVGEEGTLVDISDRSMATLRVLLYGVEALVAECAQAFARLHVRETRTHVLLPLSPNHGQFGNDGLYGETKAALEAMLNRWGSEQGAWGRHASVVGARIGWVRGTGLMNVNNAIAPGLEAGAGVRTFSASEMGLLLAACCTEGVRDIATRHPLVADLTGGMDAVADLASVARKLRSDLAGQMARARRLHTLRAQEAQELGRVPKPQRMVTPAPRFGSYFAFPQLPKKQRREQLAHLRHLDLSKVAVVVGVGEVGPWGGSRTRWSIESGGELSQEACVELAWMTGKIRFERSRNHVGWVDVKTGEPVGEHEVKARYEQQLVEGAGIRIVEPAMQMGFDPQKLTVWADVALEKDLVFPVPSKAEGEAYVRAAGEGARLVFDSAKDGWFIVRRKGSIVKVARAARLNRYVAGQVPTGWDAARYGVPKDLVEQVDRTTLFNLVSTVEAFLAAGMEPEELYEYLHPSDVGNTQGAGIGGMQKLRRLYLDHPLDKPRQGDALQETLINVTAAWIVQSLVGSYGPMVHPVGACATAAVSVEEAADKIAAGKASFIVAGGFDDYGEEGAVGFTDMGATCDSDDMLSRGIPPREMSRPNDRRRRGFVEAQGGGTVLVARADLAVKMGLPIYAVVSLARSYGDGIHRSIPAPGPGVMAVATERKAREGEQTAAELSDLATRAAEWERFQQKVAELEKVLGKDAVEQLVRDERRRRFHDFHAGDERISPLRRALATFGLTADDVAAAWKHDTSTDANDPNENRVYDRVLRWLGRSAGNPLMVVSQKALTGHSKGGAAAWQLSGAVQALSHGVIPGNPNLDDPDPAMRAYETIGFTDRAIQAAPGELEAVMLTSLGFGHVGGVICLVHPDRVLAALDDATFERYRQMRDRRERQRLRDQLAVLESNRPAVRIRSEKKFLVPADENYAGLDPEYAVLLDAASRRLEPNGPIVAGGSAEHLKGPDAPLASQQDL